LEFPEDPDEPVRAAGDDPADAGDEPGCAGDCAGSEPAPTGVLGDVVGRTPPRGLEQAATSTRSRGATRAFNRLLIGEILHAPWPQRAAAGRREELRNA
jgi:hypothetical protein